MYSFYKSWFETLKLKHIFLPRPSFLVNESVPNHDPVGRHIPVNLIWENTHSLLMITHLGGEWVISQITFNEILKTVFRPAPRKNPGLFNY